MNEHRTTSTSLLSCALASSLFLLATCWIATAHATTGEGTSTSQSDGTNETARKGVAGNQAKPKKSRHDEDGYYGTLVTPQSQQEPASAPNTQSATPAVTESDTTTPTSTPATTATTTTTPETGTAPGTTASTRPAASESGTTATPAARKLFMWKATKGDQVVYLLGTIHVARPQFYPLPQAIDAALSQADALIVEVALDRIDKTQLLQLLKGQAAYAPGDNLSKHLSPNTRKLLDAYLAWAGESLEMYQEYKPWMVQTLLESQSMRREGFAPELGIDRYLLKKAKAQNKKVQELETAAFQLTTLSAVPDADQEKLLSQSLAELKDVSTRVRELERAWRAGDEPSMSAAIKVSDSGSPELKAFFNTVLEKRNLSMTAKLNELLAGQKTVMVAVGAGHLVGENGIPALLAGKGFTVEQATTDARGPSTGIPTFAARARKLQTLYYPEGLFSVSLPGNPDTKYANVAGLRCVDYTYPEFSGLYQVSYLILPQAVNPAMANKMYDSVVAELVKKTKGTLASQHATTLQGGYYGRQIEIKTPAKTGVGAKPQPVMVRLRLSLVGKRLYIIGGTGTSAWLDSPAVDTFMNSLSIRKELSASEIARRDFQKQSSSFHDDFEARRKSFDQSFAESRSRSRKSFESGRAQHERNMYGRR